MSVQSEIDRLAGAKAGLSSWLSNNGVTVPAGTNLNGLVELLEGLQMGSNKNLLHNWDFRNPINQRGSSSYTGAKYGIDRWYVATSSVTVEVVSGGVRFSNSGSSTGYVRQLLEFATPSDEYCYTLLCSESTSESNTMYAGYADDTFSNSVPIAAGYNSVVTSGLKGVKRVQFNVAAGASVTLVAAKLERGSVSTLANDPPADYGEQLALCQRFFTYIGSTSVFTGIFGSTTQARLYIPLPVSMRISAPTITMPSSANLTCYTSSANAQYTITGFSTSRADRAYMIAHATISSATAFKTWTSVSFRNEGYWDVSADL